MNFHPIFKTYLSSTSKDLELIRFWELSVKTLFKFCSPYLCECSTAYNHEGIFTKFLKYLELIRFWDLSGNNFCHGKVFTADLCSGVSACHGRLFIPRQQRSSVRNESPLTATIFHWFFPNFYSMFKSLKKSFPMTTIFLFKLKSSNAYWPVCFLHERMKVSYNHTFTLP